MNIFILDTDIKKCCAYHCDKHVVKMILEYAQILSTCHHAIDKGADFDHTDLYRPTHIKHPCVQWAMAHATHYTLVYKMLESLLKEYTHRYDKIHKTSRLLEPLSIAPQNIKHSGVLYTVNDMVFHTLPAQCMDDAYRVEPKDEKDLSATVQAYRQYYLGEKSHILAYKQRENPHWIK